MRSVSLVCGRCGGTGKGHPLSINPEVCVRCKGLGRVDHVARFVVALGDEHVGSFANLTAAKKKSAAVPGSRIIDNECR